MMNLRADAAFALEQRHPGFGAELFAQTFHRHDLARTALAPAINIGQQAAIYENATFKFH